MKTPNDEMTGFQAHLATDRELLDRFGRSRDEEAFTVLVRRHGGMVLGVCRRILGNGPEVEDVVQATFVVLAAKAQTLTRPELLANWLHGVAFRLARKARFRAARRQFHEREAALRSVVEPTGTLDHAKELRDLLDRGLQRLPRKYRLPLILCYLQELTNQEAARKLGWRAGSMSYRLARGRALLRESLRKTGADSFVHPNPICKRAGTDRGRLAPSRR